MGLALNICCAAENGAVQFVRTLFKKGDNGFHSYRIPALECCPDGTLVAFAEARKDSSMDSGRISIAMRRSLDGGKTWSPVEIVAEGGNEYSCGNPVPLWDKKGKELILIYNKTFADDSEHKILFRKARGIRGTFVMRSPDCGKTWLTPCEISSQVKVPEQTWFAVGPSGAVQMEGGKFDGRIVCPVATATFVPQMYWAAAFFSDDGGKTWSAGEFVSYAGANESQIAQIGTDAIAINMRVQGLNPDKTRRTNFRVVALSRDGGKTWGNPVEDKNLPEPICHGSFSSARRGDSFLLAFSNPASVSKRENMTLRFSDSARYIDALSKKSLDCDAWPHRLLVCPGLSGYSDTAFVGGKHLGIVYERGEKTSFDQIDFALIDIPEKM